MLFSKKSKNRKKNLLKIYCFRWILRSDKSATFSRKSSTFTSALMAIRSASSNVQSLQAANGNMGEIFVAKCFDSI